MDLSSLWMQFCRQNTFQWLKFTEEFYPKGPPKSYFTVRKGVKGTYSYLVPLDNLLARAFTFAFDDTLLYLIVYVIFTALFGGTVSLLD